MLKSSSWRKFTTLVQKSGRFCWYQLKTHNLMKQFGCTCWSSLRAQKRCCLSKIHQVLGSKCCTSKLADHQLYRQGQLVIWQNGFWAELFPFLFLPLSSPQRCACRVHPATKFMFQIPPRPTKLYIPPGTQSWCQACKVVSLPRIKYLLVLWLPSRLRDKTLLRH